MPVVSFLIQQFLIKSKVVKSKTSSKGLKLLQQSLSKLQVSGVEVGYFNGEIHEGSEMTLAALMTLLEYGSNDGSIPARFPFTQVSAIETPSKEPNVRKKLKQGLSNTVRTGDANNLLELLGKHYVDAVGSIFGDTTRLLSNSSFTQALKGKDSPLIENGELLRKLTYRKIKKERK